MAEWSCRKPQCELGRELRTESTPLPYPNFRGDWMNGRKNITKKDLMAHAPGPSVIIRWTNNLQTITKP